MAHITSIISWRFSRIRRRFHRKIVSRIYVDRFPDTARCCIVAGTGRSGTTWLADVLASHSRSRIVFEPFHSRQVPSYRTFNYFQYMRPGDANPALEHYCESVFSGRVRDRWIDRQVETVFPIRRVVKAIRSNLFLRWIHDLFPEIPIVLLMRHPCAVVHSRMRLNWATDGDLKPFMDQPILIEDFLADKMDIIGAARTAEEKHALVWAISNLVPLSQFQGDNLHVVFYEDLLTRPDSVVPPIFTTMGIPFHESVLSRLNRPSSTAKRFSSVITGRNAVTGWTSELSSEQIFRILEIVSVFGLDHIYSESPYPIWNR